MYERGDIMNAYIDHTLLKPDATKQQIHTLCEEAIKYQFASVCVNPYWVSYCRELLKNSNVKVCTVIGFPLGANTTETKVFEAKNAIANGADELDMVINIGALKDKKYDIVLKDIKEIVKVKENTILKVIIETCLLSDEEIKKVCELCVEAHADFVKTSTGFSTSGATVHAVALMKESVQQKCLIKAAGGIRTKEDMQKMIKAGANRIGTSKGTSLIG